jgi:hypothetical protein
VKKTIAVVGVAGAALAAAALAVATTLTLVASARSVVYGKTVTLTGVLSTQKANQQITIGAVECGTTKSTNVAKVRTTTNGAYTATVTPTTGTTYQATWKTVKSSSLAVAVTPLAQLTRVARNSFSASVSAAADLKGKSLLLQRYRKLTKRWVKVKNVVLTTSAPATTKPTIVSSAAFKTKLARGTRVRVVLTKTQAAPCYAPATSNSVKN